jgi:hypothetical protein
MTAGTVYNPKQEKARPARSRPGLVAPHFGLSHGVSPQNRTLFSFANLSKKPATRGPGHAADLVAAKRFDPNRILPGYSFGSTGSFGWRPPHGMRLLSWNTKFVCFGENEHHARDVSEQ